MCCAMSFLAACEQRTATRRWLSLERGELRCTLLMLPQSSDYPDAKAASVSSTKPRRRESGDMHSFELVS